MILSFSRDSFVKDIKVGLKIHTAREDKLCRWKPGMKIHFWKGNPRNTRGKNKPYQFGEGICDKVLPVEINTGANYVQVYGIRIESKEGLDFFAKNDGFADWEDLKEWFKVPFIGRLIYWRDCNFY